MEAEISVTTSQAQTCRIVIIWLHRGESVSPVKRKVVEGQVHLSWKAKFN